MTKFVLDTNLCVRAFRSRAGAATLITDNSRDFRMIARFLVHDWVRPWPEA